LNRRKITVSKLLKDQSFRNWTEGKASLKEADYWDSWIQTSEENQKIAIEAQKQILGFRFEPGTESRAGKVWESIQHEMARREAPVYSIHESRSTARHKLRRSSAFKQVFKYAAIILIMLTGGLLWFTLVENVEEPTEYTETTYHQVRTEFGEQKEINLSDGSYIILNANSSLEYSANQGEENDVDIRLDGEAYFSVTSRENGNFNSGKDLFRVETVDGTVNVLGTSFTVSSRNEKTRVVLEEGEVLVLPGHLKEKAEPGLIIQPNELVEFSRLNTAIIRQEVDTRVYTSWKDARLILQSTPMAEVVERLEQTFGIPVNVRDNSVLNRTISGSIENTDLNTMIQILGELMSVHVEVQEEVIYLGQVKNN
jgi:transmembrane sensor